MFKIMKKNNQLIQLYYDISLMEEKGLLKRMRKMNKETLIHYDNAAGFSLLDAATMGHRTGIIKYLLSIGANPNQLNGRGGHSIITALMQTDPSNEEILRLFLENGLDLELKVQDKTIEQHIVIISNFKNNEELVNIMNQYKKV